MDDATRKSMMEHTAAGLGEMLGVDEVEIAGETVATGVKKLSSIEGHLGDVQVGDEYYVLMVNSYGVPSLEQRGVLEWATEARDQHQSHNIHGGVGSCLTGNPEDGWLRVLVPASQVPTPDVLFGHGDLVKKGDTIAVHRFSGECVEGKQDGRVYHYSRTQSRVEYEKVRVRGVERVVDDRGHVCHWVSCVDDDGEYRLLFNSWNGRTAHKKKTKGAETLRWLLPPREWHPERLRACVTGYGDTAYPGDRVLIDIHSVFDRDGLGRPVKYQKGGEGVIHRIEEAEPGYLVWMTDGRRYHVYEDPAQPWHVCRVIRR